ncbi:Beta-fructofuranosidase, insoluble isoenzyme CWINV2 [Hibiscus syriacus]|uniref:Beta-fructofuranosidase, insoluble isoenzyme CWINV2 n=1 Tax=Hibiscus syriacus TaxID=106335 RepID=A0A6A2YMI8_HIBSY|nr:Beta-fructofuranosidase, insoluble isoenzyme CWINV2 [Hibiscus syriacus]
MRPCTFFNPFAANHHSPTVVLLPDSGWVTEGRGVNAFIRVDHRSRLDPCFVGKSRINFLGQHSSGLARHWDRSRYSMEVSKSLSHCLVLRNLVISLPKGVQASHRVYPDYQFLAATTVKQLHRTAYHFQPPKHWINGMFSIHASMLHLRPMYYKGFYHLFYQYNPKGSVWGNIAWAHSFSKDLVQPSFPRRQSDHLLHGIDAKEKQLQNYAVPEDPSNPYLRKWKKPKEGNPMVVPENEVNGSSFRDPTTAWQANGYWHILVGSRKNDISVAYLFKSKDQKTWVKAPAPLHQSNQKLETGKPVKLSGVTGAQADVVVTFAIPNLDKAEAFDSSWKDPQVLCSKKKSVQGAIGPFGLMVLATEKLEEFTPVFFRIFKAKDNKPVVLLCSDEQHSTLKTDFYKPMYGGFVDVDLADKKLSLRGLIDHSVVESFAAGGKTIISNRVYPTVAVLENAHVFAFNNGTEPINLEHSCAYSMQRPQRMNK